MSRKFQLKISPGTLNVQIPGLEIHSDNDGNLRPTDTPTPKQLPAVTVTATSSLPPTHLSTAPTQLQQPQPNIGQCFLVGLAIALLGVQTYPPAWKPVEGYLRNPKTRLYALLYQPPASKATAAVLQGDLSPVQVGEEIAGYKVTSGYGPRVKPCPDCSDFHRGIDVGTSVGTPLYAVTPTNVSCYEQSGITGKFIKYPLGSLMPNYDLQILHVNSCIPGPAQKGQNIGTTGAAGTGAHGHFEVKSRIDGSKPPKNLRQLATLSLKPAGTGGKIEP